MLCTITFGFRSAIHIFFSLFWIVNCSEKIVFSETQFLSIEDHGKEQKKENEKREENLLKLTARIVCSPVFIYISLCATKVTQKNISLPSQL